MKYAKKIVALLLVVAMTASIAVAGTLAYLTDRDSKTNVFTVGNVSIELEEEFMQGSQLVPGKDVNKDVFIRNTGVNDAWVWYTYAIPQVLDTAANASANILHVNHAGANWLGYQDNQAYWADGQTEATPEDQCWIVDYNPDAGNGNPVGTVKLDNITYNVYAVLYNGTLAPGEQTTIGMTKVYLDTKVDIDTDGKLYTVTNGVASGPVWNIVENPNPMIIVSAYAIQAENINSVKEAYAAYNGQWGDNGTEYGAAPTIVTTADDLNDALANGDNVLLTESVTASQNGSAIYGTPVAVQQKNGGVFDGGSNNLDIENPENGGYAIETYGGTIQNVNVHSPVERGVVISSPNEDIYIYNVTVDGPGYALNTTEHNGKNLYVYGSTLRGWTSFAGLDSAFFGGCFFGENSSKYWQNVGYDQDYDRLIKPYVDTVFEHCVFEQGFYVDLSSLGEGCTVTLTDCIAVDLQGNVIAEPLTADNYNSFITIELPGGRTLADCVVFN